MSRRLKLKKFVVTMDVWVLDKLKKTLQKEGYDLDGTPNDCIIKHFFSFSGAYNSIQVDEKRATRKDKLKYYGEHQVKEVALEAAVPKDIELIEKLTKEGSRKCAVQIT